MKKNKISAVYKIVNTVTNECYIGSSKNVMKRWQSHKNPSTWKRCPNSPLYQDMQKYGLDNFDFHILCPVMEEYLKQVEQELIEMIQPTYNNRNAKGLDVERVKKYNRRYNQSDKGKETRRMYYQSDKCKESKRRYSQSDKGKETNRKAVKKYDNQLCSYNGETLTLNALRTRFYKKGIKRPVLEARNYLIKEK